MRRGPHTLTPLWGLPATPPHPDCMILQGQCQLLSALLGSPTPPGTVGSMDSRAPGGGGGGGGRKDPFAGHWGHLVS